MFQAYPTCATQYGRIGMGNTLYFVHTYSLCPFVIKFAILYIEPLERGLCTIRYNCKCLTATLFLLIYFRFTTSSRLFFYPAKNLRYVFNVLWAFNSVLIYLSFRLGIFLWRTSEQKLNSKNTTEMSEKSLDSRRSIYNTLRRTHSHKHSCTYQHLRKSVSSMSSVVNDYIGLRQRHT